MKLNEGKKRVMVMNGEEGLESNIHIDGTHLEQVSEFIYLGYVLDKSSRDEVDCSR